MQRLCQQSSARTRNSHPALWQTPLTEGLCPPRNGKIPCPGFANCSGRAGQCQHDLETKLRLRNQGSRVKSQRLRRERAFPGRKPLRPLPGVVGKSPPWSLAPLRGTFPWVCKWLPRAACWQENLSSAIPPKIPFTAAGGTEKTLLEGTEASGHRQK